MWPELSSEVYTVNIGMQDRFKHFLKYYFNKTVAVTYFKQGIYVISVDSIVLVYYYYLVAYMK
jgi:hypothetical protein